MQVSVEVKAGPLAGKKVSLQDGQTVTFGRTRRSDFAIPHDPFLSGVHFALECDGSACRVVDRHSANGTFLNGARVTEAAVRDGDEIRAGKTAFVVHVTAPPPLEESPAKPVQVQPEPLGMAVPTPPPVLPMSVMGAGPALVIGHWSFAAIPEGWCVVEEYGLRYRGKASFPSEAVVTEEELEAGSSLKDYIQLQLNLVSQLVLRAELGDPRPINIAGAEEAMEVVLRYQADSGQRFVQRQIYARRGRLVGVATLTSVEEEFSRLEPAFEAIVSGLSFWRGESASQS